MQKETRIEPPRADQRAMLKRLYLHQSWLNILEQADSTFSRGRAESFGGLAGG